MLLEERQSKILDQLRSLGRVYATELSHQLNVSEDTIRRDLNSLAQQKLLRRVHGGALPCQYDVCDYRDRKDEVEPIKQAIAIAALAFIEPGQTVLIDSGSTCLYIAQNLPTHFPFTVVTPSPLIASQLINQENIELILIGGKVFKPAIMSVGAVTDAMLKQIHFDLCFLGICALHLSSGITINYMEEAQTLKVMVAQSERVIGLADASKLDKVATHLIVPCNKLNTLVTSQDADPKIIAELKKQGVEILIT